MLEPMGYMAGGGEWVPPEVSPEDVGTLMGLSEAGSKGVLASSPTVVPQVGLQFQTWPGDWRPSKTKSAAPLDVAGASHPPVKALEAPGRSQSPPAKALEAPAGSSLPAEGKVRTQETTM